MSLGWSQKLRLVNCFKAVILDHNPLVSLPGTKKKSKQNENMCRSISEHKNSFYIFKWLQCIYVCVCVCIPAPTLQALCSMRAHTYFQASTSPSPLLCLLGNYYFQSGLNTSVPSLAGIPRPSPPCQKAMSWASI